MDNPTIALSLHDSMVQGFNEDKAIIEGQQHVLVDVSGDVFQWVGDRGAWRRFCLIG